MQHPRLNEALAEALTVRGYEQLTPVQSAVLGEEADKRDLIVSAKTGSGKTVAFGLAIASELLEADRAPFTLTPLGLIIAPTRELAIRCKNSIALCKAAARRDMCWRDGPDKTAGADGVRIACRNAAGCAISRTVCA